MKYRGFTSTENIQEDYRNELSNSKTVNNIITGIPVVAQS